MTALGEISIALIGYLSSTLGTGEAARLWLGALEEVATVTPVDLPDPWTAKGATASIGAEPGPQSADVRILCINADETRLMMHHPLVRRVTARWTIGMWHWETDSLPPWMLGALDCVDEVWAGSSFTARAIARHSSRTVRVMPPPILSGQDVLKPLKRAELGLPDGHLFFYEFDYRSVFDRKNPTAVVDSFRHAFSPGEGPALLVKSVNGQMFPRERDRLRLAAGGRADIIIFDSHLTDEANRRLLMTCDTYVSLHRAEGFGLSLAEAASLGKVVIATGYSGPMDFLNDSTGILIPYRLVPVGRGHYPYRPGNTWAEPDIEVAAERMRWVYLNPLQAAHIGARAAANMKSGHSPAARASAARSALVEAELRPLESAKRVTVTSSISRREGLEWRSRVSLGRQVRRARRVISGWHGASL